MPHGWLYDARVSVSWLWCEEQGMLYASLRDVLCLRCISCIQIVGSFDLFWWQQIWLCAGAIICAYVLVTTFHSAPKIFYGHTQLHYKHSLCVFVFVAAASFAPSLQHIIAHCSSYIFRDPMRCFQSWSIPQTKNMIGIQRTCHSWFWWWCW